MKSIVVSLLAVMIFTSVGFAEGNATLRGVKIKKFEISASEFEVTFTDVEKKGDSKKTFLRNDQGSAFLSQNIYHALLTAFASNLPVDVTLDEKSNIVRVELE
ncbi:MAG: hypothetical protein HYS98_02835 [Deltaproteobacteria bacterium]|nr:hypothetical protein [Deltaproteobacteria bacterium]